MQTAKKEKRDLHMVVLDLANAFGSQDSVDSFQLLPEGIMKLDKAYFLDIQFCVTTQDNPTTWNHLETGIMVGCTISPLEFTMAMKLII